MWRKRKKPWETYDSLGSNIIKKMFTTTTIYKKYFTNLEFNHNYNTSEIYLDLQSDGLNNC